MKHSYGTKFIPIKLYAPQLRITTIYKNVIRKGSKKLLTIKNSTKKINT